MRETANALRSAGQDGPAADRAATHAAASTARELARSMDRVADRLGEASGSTHRGRSQAVRSARPHARAEGGDERAAAADPAARARSAAGRRRAAGAWPTRQAATGAGCAGLTVRMRAGRPGGQAPGTGGARRAAASGEAQRELQQLRQQYAERMREAERLRQELGGQRRRRRGHDARRPADGGVRAGDGGVQAGLLALGGAAQGRDARSRADGGVAVAGPAGAGGARSSEGRRAPIARPTSTSARWTRTSDRWRHRSPDVFFAHPIPWWALAAILLLAAALAVAAYARGRVPLSRGTARNAHCAAIRLAGAARGLSAAPRRAAAAAAGGQRRRGASSWTRPAAWGSREDGVSRLAQAAGDAARALVPALRAASRVDVLSAGDRVQRADVAALSADATANRSALAPSRPCAIATVTADLAGIVLISDGGNLVPLDHAARAGGAAVPVITVGVGDAQIRYDREVRSVTAGPSAMDASLVDITATIVGHGATGRSQVRLLQGSRVLDGARRDAAAPTAHPCSWYFRCSRIAMRPRSSAWMSAPTLAS